ncbi:MAG: PAS domain-containing protein [Alphaproteobacteria bacterium]|nr:PAS domain-containing protein [Alphaproteobacteria bacterium]
MSPAALPIASEDQPAAGRMPSIHVLSIAGTGRGGLAARLDEAGDHGLRIEAVSTPPAAYAALQRARPDAILVEAPFTRDKAVLQRIVAWSGAPVIAVASGSDLFETGIEDLISPRARREDALRTIRTAILRAQGRAHRPAPVEASGLRLVQEEAEGLVILDHDGRVRFLNPAAEDMLGVATGSLTGQPFPFPVHLGESTRHTVDARDASSRTLELRFVETEWGGVPARLGSIADVSVRAALEGATGEAASMRARLRDVDTALRTPLTTVIGFCELLLGEPFGPLGDPRYHAYLRDIHQGALALLAMAQAEKRDGDPR